MSREGNFEGKNILNLLGSDPFDEGSEHLLKLLYQYRKERHSLHLDDKILTSWNGLMIAGLCELYLESRDRRYLEAAQKADCFIREHLYSNGRLHAGISSGRLGANAFLDDYAAYCMAQLTLYRATLNTDHLELAQELCGHVLNEFADEESGGLYFSARGSEKLILRPKETYDGAMPSGNSLMAWNLVRLWQLTGDDMYLEHIRKQLDFMTAEAADYPTSHGMFLCALQEFNEPSMKVIIVSGDGFKPEQVIGAFHSHAVLRLKTPTDEYPLVNDKTTYYICAGTQCFRPVNDLSHLHDMVRV